MQLYVSHNLLGLILSVHKYFSLIPNLVFCMNMFKISIYIHTHTHTYTHKYTYNLSNYLSVLQVSFNHLFIYLCTIHIHNHWTCNMKQLNIISVQLESCLYVYTYTGSSLIIIYSLHSDLLCMFLCFNLNE